MTWVKKEEDKEDDKTKREEEEDDATPSSLADELDVSEEAKQLLDALEPIDHAQYDLPRQFRVI